MQGLRERSYQGGPINGAMTIVQSRTPVILPDIIRAVFGASEYNRLIQSLVRRALASEAVRPGAEEAGLARLLAEKANDAILLSPINDDVLFSYLTDFFQVHFARVYMDTIEISGLPGKYSNFLFLIPLQDNLWNLAYIAQPNRILGRAVFGGRGGGLG